MKKLMMMSLLLCTAAFGDEYYAKFFSGANFLQDTTLNKNHTSYQTGYVIAGSLGYRLCNGLSLEAEYAYRRNKIQEIQLFGEGTSKHGHFQASSYMGNLIWNLPALCWGIDSFIGAGLGYDFQQMHTTTDRIIFNQKWKRFSWQLMGGLSLPIYCDTDITLEYNFHQGGIHIYNHAIGAGLIYKF